MTVVKELSPKAQEILKAAQAFMQDVGYNGFSFRDIAARVGIKSASIHYHYPTKGDLAAAAVHSYRTDFQHALDDIFIRNAETISRLQGYGALFIDTLTLHHRTCLCGILASEAESLPEDVRRQLDGFFADQQAWVTKVMEAGKATGEIRADLVVEAMATSFVAGLEGAMIIARSMKKPELLQQTLTTLIQLSCSEMKTKVL